jgi:hypothetical protein
MSSELSPAVRTQPPVPRWRRLVGTIAAVVVAVMLVAYPLILALMVMVVSWTGCFLECSDPHRMVAVASGAIAMVLLSIPVLIGVLSWRGSSRAVWLAFGILVLLAVVLTALNGVI